MTHVMRHTSKVSPVRDRKPRRAQVAIMDMDKSADERRFRLELARAACAKINANPQRILDIARGYARVLYTRTARPEYEEWMRILGAGAAAAIEVLTDPTERGERLRTYMPFIGTEILSATERLEVAKRAFGSGNTD